MHETEKNERNIRHLDVANLSKGTLQKKQTSILGNTLIMDPATVASLQFTITRRNLGSNNYFFVKRDDSELIAFKQW